MQRGRGQSAGPALPRSQESGTRNLLSGVRLLEKMGLVPTTVDTGDWLVVKALAKRAARGRQPKQWATVGDLEALGRYQPHWAWARVYLLALLSVVYCLRISDAASITWAGIATPGQFTFFDLKVNKCWATYPLAPYLDKLRAAVARLRRADHAEDAPIVPGGTATLRALWQEFTKNTCAQGKGWHCLKRLGAAAFRAMGGSLYGLQVWARWHSIAMPRLYSGHPASWQWATTAILPDPEADPTGRGRLMERAPHDTGALWPRDALRKPRQPKMERHAFPEPAPEDCASASDDDDDHTAAPGETGDLGDGVEGQTASDVDATRTGEQHAGATTGSPQPPPAGPRTQPSQTPPQQPRPIHHAQPTGLADARAAADTDSMDAAGRQPALAAVAAPEACVGSTRPTLPTPATPPPGPCRPKPPHTRRGSGRGAR